MELITRTSFGGNGCGRTRERQVCEILDEESDFTGFHFPFFGRKKKDLEAIKPTLTMDSSEQN